MKRKVFKLVIIALGFSLMNCSSIKVTSDKDPNVDFTKFKTFEFYGWAENSDQKLTRFDKERIEQAFGEEARLRGLSRVESNGDMIVTLNVVGQVKVQQTANTTTTGMATGGRMGRRGMRGPGWGWGTAQSTTVVSERQYVEGSLIVEAYDPVKKVLIWQAIGTKTVNEDPQKRAAEIPKKVKAIMKEYPVPPMSN